MHNTLTSECVCLRLVGWRRIVIAIVVKQTQKDEKTKKMAIVNTEKIAVYVMRIIGSDVQFWM